MYRDFQYEKFTKNLAKQRKQAGFTQKQVEKQLKMRSLTIYDYESGRLKVPIDDLVRLSDLYKVKIEKLLSITNEEVNDVNQTMHSLIQVVPLTRIGFVATKYKELYDLIFDDPVIQVELDMEELKHSETLLDIFSKKLTVKQKRSFLVELLKYTNSVIGVDRKISPAELTIRDILIEGVSIDLSESEIKAISKTLNVEYLGSNIAHAFPRDSFKHLLTWILFLVALADNYYHPKEAEYIRRVAENIGLSKKHYLYIEKKVLEKIDKYNHKG